MENINPGTITKKDSLEQMNKFTFLSDYLAKTFNKKNSLHIINKRNSYNKTFTSQLIYKKKSETNPMNYDLYFSITLDTDYPRSVPIVKSLTHFSFPTLFDNRNLIFSVINHNWVGKNSDSPSANNLFINDNSDYSYLTRPLEEIIHNIPKFLNRLIENTSNKILVYYGDYKIDSIYDMNDFLTNQDLDFFRVEQVIRKEKKKERYIVLTDVYFLFFDPAPSTRNYAKLLFWGDLRQIQIKTEDQGLFLEWKSKDKIIGFSVDFKAGLREAFKEKCLRKAQKLQDQYKIFQDDIVKPNEDDIVSKLNDMNLNDLEKLVLLVKYKEELLEKSNSVNLVKELMSLYQKIIEIQSAKGEDFKDYLDKLHRMLNDKDTQNSLDTEEKSSVQFQNFEDDEDN
jgi:hypothetical protein